MFLRHKSDQAIKGKGCHSPLTERNAIGQNYIDAQEELDNRNSDYCN